MKGADRHRLREGADAGGGQARPPAALSIDVEDWFHDENLKSVIASETWGQRRLRVERSTDRVLELVGEAGVRCTWFVLGWVAEQRPRLVERIAAAGHEIASHGYRHELVYTQSPDAFREDVARSKALLEQLAGAPVRGYRAPTFSITDWSIPILQELGFTYDSSFFPTVAHDRYGRLADVPAHEPISELRAGFHEVALSCLAVGRVQLPWAGGGYFRLIPYPVFRRGVARIRRSGSPYVFYVHPWEFDPSQPRLRGLSPVPRFRHYVGLERVERRFTSLLRDFRWCAIADVLAGWREARRAASAPRG